MPWMSQPFTAPRTVMPKDALAGLALAAAGMVVVYARVRNSPGKATHDPSATNVMV